MATKLLIILLLFVSVWVGLAILAWYKSRRPAPWTTPAGALPAGRGPDGQGSCCIEVPCSDECARWHQEMRDRLEHRFDLVAVEAMKVIRGSQAGDNT